MDAKMTIDQITSAIANEHKIHPDRIHAKIEEDVLTVQIDERTEDEHLTLVEVEEITTTLLACGWDIFASDPDAEEGDSWVFQGDLYEDERIWLDRENRASGWVMSDTSKEIYNEAGRQIGEFDESGHAHYEGFEQD